MAWKCNRSSRLGSSLSPMSEGTLSLASKTHAPRFPPRPAQGVLPSSRGRPFGVAERLVSRSIRAREVEALPAGESASFAGHEEWEDNVQPALAACVAAGVPPDIARRGMDYILAGFGALTAWSVRAGCTTWIAVNGSAANDPDATCPLLQRAAARWNIADRTPLVGLLNLRAIGAIERCSGRSVDAHRISRRELRSRRLLSARPPTSHDSALPGGA